MRAVVAVLLGLVAACGGAERDEEDPAGGWRGLAPPGAKPPRTILVLLADTLRADHTSLLGYERPTTPELEELAEEAIVFTNARSTAPWTLPSHASLFSGLYPHEHGAHTYAAADPPAGNRRGGGGADTDAEEPEDPGEDVQGYDPLDIVAPLAGDVTTLAEVLAKRGYRTGAVVANIAFLHPRYQLDQGFEAYDAARGDVRAIHERALAWLDAQGEEPCFLFLNYMDTHRPYNCAPRKGFPNRGNPKSSGRRMMQLRRMLIEGAEDLPPELVAELKDQYDTAIANLDEGLGELFDALRERGRFDDALIVFTSDHGEFFGEQGLVEHSKDVYEPVLHVPLLVRPPGGTVAARDEDPISGVHVPAIVLSWAGVGPDEAAACFGHWPRGELVAENYYSRKHDMKGAWLERFRRVRRALYRDGLKFIESSDGAHELYDLRADPGETTNLFALEPERAAALAADLTARVARAERVATERVDVGEGDAGTLSELGYGGGDEDEEEDVNEDEGEKEEGAQGGADGAQR